MGTHHAKQTAHVFNGDDAPPTLKTLDDIWVHGSTKLITVIRLIRFHVANPSADALQFDESNGGIIEPEASSEIGAAPVVLSKPPKFVIFVEFPSLIDSLREVSDCLINLVHYLISDVTFLI